MSLRAAVSFSNPDSDPSAHPNDRGPFRILFRSSSQAKITVQVVLHADDDTETVVP